MPGELMKSVDINLSNVTFGNPNDTQNFGAFAARLQEILNEISNLHRVKIVTVAPTAKELQEIFNTSEIVILHDATAANRKVWYKYGGTAYAIQGS